MGTRKSTGGLSALRMLRNSCRPGFLGCWPLADSWPGEELSHPRMEAGRASRIRPDSGPYLEDDLQALSELGGVGRGNYGHKMRHSSPVRGGRLVATPNPTHISLGLGDPFTDSRVPARCRVCWS